MATVPKRSSAIWDGPLQFQKTILLKLKSLWDPIPDFKYRGMPLKVFSPSHTFYARLCQIYMIQNYEASVL